jgi:hypothetical protein
MAQRVGSTSRDVRARSFVRRSLPVGFSVLLVIGHLSQVPIDPCQMTPHPSEWFAKERLENEASENADLAEDFIRLVGHLAPMPRAGLGGAAGSSTKWRFGVKLQIQPDTLS